MASRKFNSILMKRDESFRIYESHDGSGLFFSKLGNLKLKRAGPLWYSVPDTPNGILLDALVACKFAIFTIWQIEFKIQIYDLHKLRLIKIHTNKKEYHSNEVISLNEVRICRLGLRFLDSLAASLAYALQKFLSLNRIKFTE